MQQEEKIQDRAVLVGLVGKGETQESVDRSLDELEGLLKTAGGSCVARLTQNKDTPDVRTVIGSGKAAELAYLCACNDVTLVVFDCELSPSQLRNLEGILCGSSPVPCSFSIFLLSTPSRGRESSRWSWHS